MEKNNKVKNNTKTKSHKRRIIVAIFTLLFIIISYILFRGRYLETLEIGGDYVSVFWKNVQYKTLTIIVVFILSYLWLYITNHKIQNGLKEFYEDENRKMPKLPNKSISFIISIIVSAITCNFVINKVILFFNSTSFGIEDKVFGYDIGYYLFKQPLIEFAVIYLIGLLIASTIYAGIYYIVVLNTSFDGVRSETLKNSKIVNQLDRKSTRLNSSH